MKSFKSFYEQLPVPYQSLDESGNILEVNTAWLETMGWKQKDVIGKNLTDFLNEESKEEFKNNLSKLKTTGKIIDTVYNMVRADGSVRSVGYVGRKASYGGNRPLKIHCLFHDITEDRLKDKKIEYLNAVIETTRSINRDIINEKNEKTLIRTICNRLTSLHWYNSAWIVLFDNEGKVRLSAENGFTGAFDSFIKTIEEGKAIPCMDKVLESDSVVIVREQRKNCAGCPLAPKDIDGNTALCTKVSYGGRVYGVISAYKPAAYADYEEAVNLFQEVSNDIGFALHGIETERDKTKAEEDLRASEAFNRSIVENNPDCIKVLDTDGRLEYMSESGRRLMEIEDINRYIGTDWRKFWKGEDYTKAVKAVSEAARGETGSFNGYCPTAKGTPKWWNVIITPLYNTDGSIKSLLAVSRDISKEKKLTEEYNRLYNAVEQSPIGVIMMDVQHRVVYSNSWFQKICGYERDEIVGNTLDFLKSGEHTDKFYEEFYKTVMSGKVWKGEIRNKRKNGELYWADVTAVPIKSSRGTVTGYIEYILDITDKKKLEEQFLQSQKLETVGRLAGGVAHDFNNMLTVINGYSEFALNNLKPSDTYYTYFKEIKDAGKRAEGIARQLLAFSRKQVLKPKVLNINDVLKALKKILLKLLGEDIKLELELYSNVSLIEADEGQIEQVIMNLCINARDAMPNGGTLTFETANLYLDDEYVKIHSGVKEGYYVMFSITDTGIGMDKDTQDNIFEPFFTTKPIGKGTGLGLSTVYGVVKQSGGNIWVYSEKGKGTTFKIYLPAVDTSKKQEENKTADSTEDLRGNEKVLVVEDEDIVRKVTVDVLSSYGYKVFSASGGEEAVKICSDNRDIDLIISDVVMPGMNGRQVTAVLVQYCPDAKLLYMSGYTNNVIAHRHILDEGVNFIEKPFTPQMIALKVREVLNKG